MQQPCKFPASPAYSALHGSFRNAQHLRNLLVIHVLHVAQDHRLAQLRRQLRKRLLDAHLQLHARRVRLRGWMRVGQLAGWRRSVVLPSVTRIQ